MHCLTITLNAAVDATYVVARFEPGGANRVGRKLIDSMTVPTVVRDTSALRAIPIRPRRVDEALAQAITNEDQEYAATRRSDPVSSSGETQDWRGVRFGARLVDSRTVTVGVPPAAAFAPIVRIGGRTGWYYATWLWRVRGLLDLLIGGVGMRRGRN